MVLVVVQSPSRVLFGSILGDLDLTCLVFIMKRDVRLGVALSWFELWDDFDPVSPFLWPMRTKRL